MCWTNKQIIQVLDKQTDHTCPRPTNRSYMCWTKKHIIHVLDKQTDHTLAGQTNRSYTSWLNKQIIHVLEKQTDHTCAGQKDKTNKHIIHNLDKQTDHKRPRQTNISYMVRTTKHIIALVKVLSPVATVWCCEMSRDLFLPNCVPYTIKTLPIYLCIS